MQITAKQLCNIADIIKIDGNTWTAEVTEPADWNPFQEEVVQFYAEVGNESCYMASDSLIEINEEGKGFITLRLDEHEELPEEDAVWTPEVEVYVLKPLNSIEMAKRAIGVSQ